MYLVDVKKINIQNYEPIMKRNPFKNILNNDNWDKEVDKYKIRIVKQSFEE